ncbi:hypothetical protein BH20VER3_BH20VER3_02130 [soil metagenome]
MVALSAARGLYRSVTAAESVSLPRPPPEPNLTILEDMCLGHTVADVMVILGSIDIVLGEVDR